jgi:hypothetical protein
MCLPPRPETHFDGHARRVNDHPTITETHTSHRYTNHSARLTHLGKSCPLSRLALLLRHRPLSRGYLTAPHTTPCTILTNTAYCMQRRPIFPLSNPTDERAFAASLFIRRARSRGRPRMRISALNNDKESPPSTTDFLLLHGYIWDG